MSKILNYIPLAIAIWFLALSFQLITLMTLTVDGKHCQSIMVRLYFKTECKL